MLQSKAWRSPASRLVDTHWKLIKRLTNDEDEAHELAVRLLEKFDQFDPNHAFAQFIRLKLRELRQHYSDKGVVGHPTRKEAGGYVSFDKCRDLKDEEESGTLYDFEPTLRKPRSPDVSCLHCDTRYRFDLADKPHHAAIVCCGDRL